VVARAPVSGNNQVGTVGQALASPIRVLVTRDGQPEVGATVTWSASGTGALMSPASDMTDAAGLAASTWTLPHAAGTPTAAATVSGANGSPVGFSATAQPGAATTLALKSGNSQSGEVSMALSAPLKVRAADQFGNGVAGVLITWQATGGGGSVAPSTSTTDTTGATTAWTLGATLGAQGAQGAAAGLTGSPVAFTATGTPPPPPTSDVVVSNNAFTPNALTITAGTRVRWTWGAGALLHSVESTGTGAPGSPTFTSSATMTGAGSVYTFTFNTPGVYTYDCVVHGALMQGTVTVN
jgi:plastocyanin